MAVAIGDMGASLIVILNALRLGMGNGEDRHNPTVPRRAPPVAVDAIGVRILQAKRRLVFEEERPLNPPPKHILLADTRHHLGTADPQKIELVKLGWQTDTLI